ncbi:MAG: B3/4 domain-containing protein [Marinifilaceae bacterium]
MIDIKIREEIALKCPELTLGCISCKVETINYNPALWEFTNEKIEEISKDISNASIREMETIHSSKQAYKKLGKDPNRYRPSAESLLRRIVNGKGLYQINNVVDLLNLVSITSGFSIGGYNEDKIVGQVNFGKGEANEEYEGIGRGKLNIENLPMFRDEVGAFGCPTSDSIRTQVDENCQKFLMIIISFQGEKDLSPSIEFAKELLIKYANGKEIETRIIKP